MQWFRVLFLIRGIVFASVFAIKKNENIILKGKHETQALSGM